MSDHAGRSELKPGEIRVFERGSNKALALVIGIWAEKPQADGPIQIHITGTPSFHTSVTNQVSSERYHRTLFRNLRRLLANHDRWPFGDDGAETESKE